MLDGRLDVANRLRDLRHLLDDRRHRGGGQVLHDRRDRRRHLLHLLDLLDRRLLHLLRLHNELRLVRLLLNGRRARDGRVLNQTSTGRHVVARGGATRRTLKHLLLLRHRHGLLLHHARHARGRANEHHGMHSVRLLADRRLLDERRRVRLRLNGRRLTHLHLGHDRLLLLLLRRLGELLLTRAGRRVRETCNRGSGRINPKGVRTLSRPSHSTWLQERLAKVGGQSGRGRDARRLRLYQRHGETGGIRISCRGGRRLLLLDHLRHGRDWVHYRD